MRTTRKITDLRQALEASRCRRRREREKLNPTAVRCWNHVEAPAEVFSIEVDKRGARLVLPWTSVPGEHIRVSVSNGVGEYSTTRARVVWTQNLPNSSKVIVGLCFDSELHLAA